MFPTSASLLFPLALVACVGALGVPPRNISSQMVARATVLADGTSMQYSSSALPNGLKWQASGFLQQGGCSSGTQLINDCYELRLTDDPTMQLDPSGSTPRQRIEFLTAHRADGTKWQYTWRSYYPSSIKGGVNFFHIMQIFSVGAGAPVYTLSIVRDMVYLKDVVANQNVATATLSSMTDRTLVHRMTVTYGQSGSISYSVSSTQAEAPILNYSRNNAAVGTGGAYLKFGTYRATYQGMSLVKAWYGDFIQTQLS